MKYIYSSFFACILVFQIHAQYANVLNDTLNETLSKKFNQYDLNGVTAAVTFPDGSIWTNTEGKYGNTDLTPNVLFEPGSISKSTIGATILLLEEAGKLSIDDTLYHYLSLIQNVSYGITIKQLLNHTSGLYNYTSHPDFLTFVNDLSNWNTVLPVDSALANFIDPPLQSPGINWSYCNTGFLLLGKVIEQVENKALNVVLDSLLFTPLSLENTFLAAYDPYPNDHAGYWLDATSHEPDVFVSFLSAAWAAGGLLMTSADVAKWGNELFSGNVLSDNSFAKMTEYVNDGNDGYGLSIERRYFRMREYLGHTGGTLMQAKLSHSVEYDFTVSVISNDYGSFNPTRLIENAIIDVVNYYLDNHLYIETQALADDVNIFPNPSTDQMLVQNLKGFETLHILDVNGVKMASYNLSQNHVRLDKAVLGAGMFIIQLVHQNGTVVHKKAIFN